jgi:hypothetical protein
MEGRGCAGTAKRHGQMIDIENEGGGGARKERMKLKFLCTLPYQIHWWQYYDRRVQYHGVHVVHGSTNSRPAVLSV